MKLPKRFEPYLQFAETKESFALYLSLSVVLAVILGLIATHVFEIYNLVVHICIGVLCAVTALFILVILETFSTFD